jgi:hypothetical protein
MKHFDFPHAKRPAATLRPMEILGRLFAVAKAKKAD